MDHEQYGEVFEGAESFSQQARSYRILFLLFLSGLPGKSTPSASDGLDPRRRVKLEASHDRGLNASRID
jgi:hypothetical protein